MEREKMIEEMRDKRASELVNDMICKVDHCDKAESCTICKAEHLTGLGWQKIPEGAVVLTREEYNKVICGIMDKHNVSEDQRIFITLLSIELEKYIFKGVEK